MPKQFVFMFVLVLIKAILPVATTLFAQEVTINPRQSGLGLYPCSDCHVNIDEKNNPAVPLSKPHQKLEFKHMKQISQCTLCHDSQSEFNQLRLIDLSVVSFDESYQVCLQCHGDKKKDWSRGIHGKQIGSWNGKKFRFNCVECHNPHTPKFAQYTPHPPPVFPKLGGPKHK